LSNAAKICARLAKPAATSGALSVREAGVRAAGESGSRQIQRAELFFQPLAAARAGGVRGACGNAFRI
jgi:hypothetical protein